jgi:hypothetical protein
MLAVSTLALTAARPARADDAACFPACRTGYLCHEGRCISACNPPCGAGETCTSAGECISAAPPAAPLIGETARAAAPMHAADPGWARGAFYFGAVSVAADIALTAAVMATNPQQAATSRVLGAWSIAVFGISVPMTALGGNSARTHPGVTGLPRIRIASWIGYALTLGEAAWLLSDSHRAIIKDGYILSVGVFGTLSTLGFAADAYASAAQAERLQLTATARPTLGLATGRAGGLVPTVGWAGRF